MDSARKHIAIYDTTLRDGTQREGISLSVADKLRVTGLLDDLGVAYIEGGWPGSNQTAPLIQPSSRKSTALSSRSRCSRTVASSSAAISPPWVVRPMREQPEMDARLLPGAAELPFTPFSIGSHLSTPVVLGDGSVYGTMCCFSFEAARPLVERDLKRLRMAADLTARLIDQRHRD